MLVLLWVAPVGAVRDPRDPLTRGDPLTHGWTAKASGTETYVDNLFEDGPQVRPRPDLFTTVRGEVRREVRRAGWLPTTIAASFGGEVYRRTGAADNIFYGAELRKKLGRFVPAVYYRGSPRRLLFIEEQQQPGLPPEQRNVLYRQNIFGAELTHTLLPSRRLRLELGYQTELRDFRPAFSDRDYISYSPRLRGEFRVSPLFTPKVRVGYEIQDARAPKRTREGVKSSAGFEGEWRRASWEFRWDLTRWKYPLAAPDDSNFGRRDERNAFVFETAVRLVRGAFLTLRYRYLDGASTREDRNFTKNEVSGGLAYWF